jgi:hypothetical protein
MRLGASQNGSPCSFKLCKVHSELQFPHVRIFLMVTPMRALIISHLLSPVAHDSSLGKPSNCHVLSWTMKRLAEAPSLPAARDSVFTASPRLISKHAIVSPVSVTVSQPLTATVITMTGVRIMTQPSVLTCHSPCHPTTWSSERSPPGCAWCPAGLAVAAAAVGPCLAAAGPPATQTSAPATGHSDKQKIVSIGTSTVTQAGPLCGSWPTSQ